jgi:hypothetical protein
VRYRPCILLNEDYPEGNSIVTLHGIKGMSIGPNATLLSASPSALLDLETASISRDKTLDRIWHTVDFMFLGSAVSGQSLSQSYPHRTSPDG